MVQWLRTHLPMQGTQAQSLAWEYSTRPSTTATEAQVPRAHALQQEKPAQRGICALQRRVVPAQGNQRKPECSKKDPVQGLSWRSSG